MTFTVKKTTDKQIIAKKKIMTSKLTKEKYHAANRTILNVAYIALSVVLLEVCATHQRLYHACIIFIWPNLTSLTDMAKNAAIEDTNVRKN